MADSPWPHAEQARAALRAIVSDPQHGPGVLSSTQTVSNLLKDLLPDAPRETSLLVAAAGAGVADSLRDNVRQGMDAGTAIRLAASSLAAKSAITPEACYWVVGEIAVALGLSDPADVPAAPASVMTMAEQAPASRHPEPPAAPSAPSATMTSGQRNYSAPPSASGPQHTPDQRYAQAPEYPSGLPSAPSPVYSPDPRYAQSPAYSPGSPGPAFQPYPRPGSGYGSAAGSAPGGGMAPAPGITPSPGPVSGGRTPWPALPASVRGAVTAMWAGAALHALSILVVMSSGPRIRAMILRSRPAIGPNVVAGTVAVFIAILVLAGLIEVGLWLWMAAMNRRGRPWARILSTIFFVIGTVAFLVALGIPVAGYRLLELFGWLDAVAATVLMWLRSSGAYYRASRTGEPIQPYR